MQQSGVPLIAFNRRADFFAPELGSGRWPPEKGAVMAMPETAIDKEHRPSARENQIGFSRQVASVKAKPEALAMQGFPNQHFRLCVFTADRSHVPAACPRIMDVRQRAASASALVFESTFPHVGA